MKILLLSNKVPYPARDGSSIAIKSIAENLLENGADVMMLSINTLKHYRDPKNITQALPSRLRFESVVVNTNITPGGIFINLLKGEPYHVSRFYNRGFFHKLKEVLAEEEFDIIQLEGLSMAVYLEDIRLLCSRAKVILRAHNVEHIIWQRQTATESNLLKKWYLHLQSKRLKKFEQKILKKIDGLVAITDNDYRGLEGMGMNKPGCVIPYGRKLASKDNNSAYLSDIAYLASFDWLPNLRGLIWFLDLVWPQIIQLRPECSMRIGGKELPLSFVKKLPAGVEYCGAVDDAERFIDSGEVVIVPLLAGSGMRIKIVDNMALGKAMVSTSIGAEGTESNNGVNIFIEDEPEKFAEKICLLLSDIELRKKMEMNAMATVERYYDPNKLGEKLLKFYNSL